MLLIRLLISITAVAELCQGFRGPGSDVARHGIFPDRRPKPGSHSKRKNLIERRQVSTSAGCNTGAQITTKAPKTNVFKGLTDDEAAAVTSFLHRQKKLNLTAAANATSWDNRILQVELLQPNKSDVLSYLDANKAAPIRYARAVIVFGATLEPHLEEYQVGPLPVTKGSTTVVELNYPYNKGRGYQRLYDLDAAVISAFTYEVTANITDIVQLLLNGTAVGAPNDTLAIAGTTPLIFEDNRTYQWNQLYTLHTGACFDEDILPSGLMFKADITGRDPSQWSVLAWQYNGIFYKSTAAFRRAVRSPGFVMPGPSVDGPWACTDWNNETLPHDNLNPPVPVQPDGARFAVDEQEQYVEWMDFSFYLSSNRDLGMQLHDIKYKGERIIYELGLQEAVAHYASASDPFQGSNAYLDSEDGFGQFAFQLVSGFDCPAYATYLNTSFYIGETTHTHPSSICLFEFDPGYPIQRHTTPTYVAVTKNTMFVVRMVSTVGNYDYDFDYEFYLDGSIHVTVRASGYIQSSFWTTNMGPQDGFHIHDHLAGSMHDHVLNYKLDLDVLGTANSLVKSELVPITQTYAWSNGKPRNTMTFERTFIESEDDGKLNWDVNNAVMYSVVNKDARNPYGEYRGYKIMPATGNRNYMTIKNSTTLGPSVDWATNHLYAVQHKDTEPHSSYPYNSEAPFEPVVDFNKFFNGESLDQEDIVIYFNLGMHHIPDTSDVPNTVFTSAQSSMIIVPQNYLLGDASRSTIHQTRINVVNGTVTDALTFNAKQPTCDLNLAVTAPNLRTFVGESVIGKYPYLPDSQMIGDPGDGFQVGIP